MLYQQLRRKMTLLGKLSIIEGLARRLEIRTAILAVSVEEERVKTSIEIVVVRHILSRPVTPVELLEAAMKISRDPLRPRPKRRMTRAVLRQRKREQIG